jgi:hypothetical protein
VSASISDASRVQVDSDDEPLVAAPTKPPSTKKRKSDGGVRRRRSARDNDDDGADDALASGDDDDDFEPARVVRAVETVRTKPSSSSKKRASTGTVERVACPVCGMSIVARMINAHLDSCVGAVRAVRLCCHRTDALVAQGDESARVHSSPSPRVVPAAAAAVVYDDDSDDDDEDEWRVHTDMPLLTYAAVAEIELLRTHPFLWQVRCWCATVRTRVCACVYVCCAVHKHESAVLDCGARTRAVRRASEKLRTREVCCDVT